MSWQTVLALLLIPVTLEPPLEAELARFPTKEIAAGCMEFNRQYLRHVEGMRLLCPQRAEYWFEVERETDRLWYCWDALQGARYCEGEYEEGADRDGMTPAEYRRYWFQHLRELIGDEAFHAGQMPPAAPVWRFEAVP